MNNVLLCVLTRHPWNRNINLCLFFISIKKLAGQDSGELIMVG